MQVENQEQGALAYTPKRPVLLISLIDDTGGVPQAIRSGQPTFDKGIYLTLNDWIVGDATTIFTPNDAICALCKSSGMFKAISRICIQACQACDKAFNPFPD